MRHPKRIACHHLLERQLVLLVPSRLPHLVSGLEFAVPPLHEKDLDIADEFCAVLFLVVKVYGRDAFQAFRRCRDAAGFFG